MLETFNLSAFGAFHTLVSVIAVIAGLVALAFHGEITTRTSSGLWFVRMTVASCLTGLAIFRHGGFGPPHALSILTLVLLAVTYWLERRATSTVPVRCIIVLGNSLALFFHLLPALTETGTRLPLGQPAFTGPEDPMLQSIVGAGFLVYLIGAFIQARRILRRHRSTTAAESAYG